MIRLILRSAALRLAMLTCALLLAPPLAVAQARTPLWMLAQKEGSRAVDLSTGWASCAPKCG